MARRSSRVLTLIVWGLTFSTSALAQPGDVREPPHAPTGAPAAATAAVPTASAASAASAATPDGSARLSLVDVMKLVRGRSFDALLADLLTETAEANVRIAGAVANPQLQGAIGFAYAPSGPTTPASRERAYVLGISDQGAIFDALSGKRGLRVDAARAARGASEGERAEVLRGLEQFVKEEYLDLSFSRAALAFTIENQKAAGETLDLNRARYPKVIDEGALARIETAKFQADADVDEAALEVHAHELQLLWITGLHGGASSLVTADEFADYRVPPEVERASLDGLSRLAFEHRTDLKALRLHVQESEASLALARRQRFPDIALSLQYTQIGGGSAAIQPPTVLVGATGNLPVFNQYSGEIRRADVELAAQRLRVSKLESEVTRDVTQALSEFQTAQRAVLRMRNGLLDRAQKARDITEFQFRRGATPLMDFLDAQRTFIATRRDYLRALDQYWKSIFRLERAVGMELRS